MPTSVLVRHPHRGHDGVEASDLVRGRLSDDVPLAQRIRLALRSTGYSNLRTVEVDVRERLVVLSGHVPTYYLKQVAQTAALAVRGMRELRNNVEVASAGRSDGRGGPEPID